MDKEFLKNWPITLPTYPPETLDNSMLETYARCPRLGLYQYGLRRSPVGDNFPINFGIAYHRYRETVEDIMREERCEMNDDVHLRGLQAAMDGWVDPEIGHKKDYLNQGRLALSLEKARERIETEQRNGRISVVRTEDAFDLEFPFLVCHTCGYGRWHFDVEAEPGDCPRCEVPLERSRHGGRMDQIIDWRGKLWIRDFKTTSRMGKTYPQKFDPNNQMTGYVWAGQELSGRTFEGTLIEVLYNTKNNGPEFHQFLSTRSPGQIQQWLGSMYMERRMIRQMWAESEEIGYLAFPQRTQACSDYGGCYYREVCTQDSGWALEKKLEERTVYSEWDFTDPDKEADEAVPA